MHPPTTWTERNLDERFLGLLDSLLHALVHKILPQYFVTSDNLFANINDDFAVTVAQKVSNMRKRPFDFINRANTYSWNEEFQGITIEEMLHWDDNHKDCEAPIKDTVDNHKQVECPVSDTGGTLKESEASVMDAVYNK